MKKLVIALALTAFSLPTLSIAGPSKDQVADSLKKAYPQVPLKSVNVLPSGMFEVVLQNNRPAYVSEDGKFLFTGDMLEIATKRNVSNERAAELSKIKFESLPLQDAIKIVKGSGARKMAVFTDPDCPYCKRLEEAADKLKNVTIYVLPFPLPMHPGAVPKAESVYCAKSPADAWSDMMLRDKDPKVAKCKNPVASIKAAAQKLGISGTPTIYFEDGTQASGALPTEALEERLKKASSSK